MYDIIKDPKCPECKGQMYLLGELGSFHFECEECGRIRVMRGSSREKVIAYQETEGHGVRIVGRTMYAKSLSKD
jgi:tRNA(Ile2) C34 agmatinyltransferase TiaS